ncbi:MAG: NUDIX hydrolase [Chloroflexi bacterium]|nr:NUDIX hydrolase [Chloroflexota bacterium]MBT4514293.1 NUDIX hydrolase [Chloroflexota bacterium]MBT6681678.1 NUDIX hydrolase [Chloroflexota bacterium]
MRHRIRSGALITRDGGILLVQSDSDLGLKWWTPGGRVDDEETWAHCAIRETFEETGLRIEIGRLAYVYEMITPENNTHHFHVLYQALNPLGDLRMAGPGDPGYDARQSEIRFVQRDEVSNTQTWPAPLRNTEFWPNLEAGFPSPIHLGMVAQ